MDYAKAITFVFQDKNWAATILIGGGVTLIGFFFFWTIIGPFLAYALVLGYMMKLIRDVHQDPDAGLPAWDDWGKKMADGLKLMVAYVIWQLPLFLLATPLLLGFFLPMFISDSDAMVVVSMVSYFALLCVGFLYSIFFLIVQPAITVNLTIHDDFVKAFEFSSIFGMIRDHLAEVLIIALLIYGIGYFASMVGILLFLIGVVFTSFWVTLVRGHLYGQLARLAFPVQNQESTSLTPAQSTTTAS